MRIRVHCGEGLPRAINVNSISVLHVLATKKMPKAHDFWRCIAAENPAIHAKRGGINPADL